MFRYSIVVQANQALVMQTADMYDGDKVNNVSLRHIQLRRILIR